MYYVWFSEQRFLLHATDLTGWLLKPRRSAFTVQDDLNIGMSFQLNSLFHKV